MAGKVLTAATSLTQPAGTPAGAVSQGSLVPEYRQTDHETKTRSCAIASGRRCGEMSGPVVGGWGR